MSKTDSYVRVRIDSATKKRVTEIFKAEGITVSEAIRIILHGVAEDGY